MGFFDGIGKVLSSVTKFANKALSIIKAPMDFITKPLSNVVGKVLDKLPFGLGKVVKPFVDTFLNQGLAWLAGGPLGGFMSLLNKIAPTAEKIVDVLNLADRAVNGGLKNMEAPALENARNAFAYTQAQSLLG
jgi:hypothetical protein